MLDLLETLASRVRDVPVLLLTLARPELLSTRSTWGGGLPAYTALPLEPLGTAHAQELARRLLESAGAGDGSASGLAETAEGNPLYIEELASSVVEQRATVDGLPTSIRGIVAARLDALPRAERDALLDASVVGKVFWNGALVCMVEDEAARLEALDSLEGRDLIRRDRVSRLQGFQQFAFKHQLICEVAYSTLPRAFAASATVRSRGSSSTPSARSPTLRPRWPTTGAKLATLCVPPAITSPQAIRRTAAGPRTWRLPSTSRPSPSSPRRKTSCAATSRSVRQWRCRPWRTCRRCSRAKVARARTGSPRSAGSRLG